MSRRSITQLINQANMIIIFWDYKRQRKYLKKVLKNFNSPAKKPIKKLKVHLKYLYDKNRFSFFYLQRDNKTAVGFIDQQRMKNRANIKNTVIEWLIIFSARRIILVFFVYLHINLSCYFKTCPRNPWGNNTNKEKTSKGAQNYPEREKRGN